MFLPLATPPTPQQAGRGNTQEHNPSQKWDTVRPRLTAERHHRQGGTETASSQLAETVQGSTYVAAQAVDANHALVEYLMLGTSMSVPTLKPIRARATPEMYCKEQVGMGQTLSRYPQNVLECAEKPLACAK